MRPTKRSISPRNAFCILCICHSISLARPASAVVPVRRLQKSYTSIHHHLHQRKQPTTTSYAFTAINALRGGAIEAAHSNGPTTIAKKKQRRKGKSSKKISQEDIKTKDKDGASAHDDKTIEEDDDSGAKEEDDISKKTKDSNKDNTAPSSSSDTKLPFTERTFDSALVSIGLSLGTAGTDIDSTAKRYNSDGIKVDTLAYYQYSHRDNSYKRRMAESEQSQSILAVIGNYFLKTHGGTHIIQCLLSLLTCGLGLACLVLPAFPTSSAVVGSASSAATATTASATKAAASNAKLLSRKILLSTMKYQLIQQTLLVSSAKHAAGLLGAVLLGASRIPQLGIRNARRHIELVASDPVGQYLFYCSVLVVWMGWFGGGSSGGMGDYVSKLRGSVISIMNASAASSTTASSDDATVTAQLLDTLSQQPPPWFLLSSYGGAITPLLILGPILLRELLSIIWVFSDVLTLAANSSNGITGKALSGMLSTCRATLDAFMTIFIKSDQWRKADSFQRQHTLSKLISRISLMMELMVGLILIGDAIASFWTFAFGNVGGTGALHVGRLPFKCVLGKIACAQLYLNFIVSRRKKVATVTGSVRGEK